MSVSSSQQYLANQLYDFKFASLIFNFQFLKYIFKNTHFTKLIELENPNKKMYVKYLA